VDLALLVAALPVAFFVMLLLLRRPRGAADVPAMPPALVDRDLAERLAPTISAANGFQLGGAFLCALAVLGFALARLAKAHSLDDDTTSVPTLEEWYCAGAAAIAVVLAVLALAREMIAKDPAFAAPSLELRLGWLILAGAASVTLQPHLEGYLMHQEGPDSAFERDAWYTTMGLLVVTALMHIIGPLRWMEYRELREYQFGPAAGALMADASFMPVEMRASGARRGSRGEPASGLGYSISSLWAGGLDESKEESGLYAPLVDGEDGSEGACKRKYSPELYTTPLGYFTFAWLNQLVATGYRRPLTQDDLYPLHPEEAAPLLAKRLDIAWEHEKHRAAKANDSAPPAAKQKKASLAKAMWKAFGRTFVFACFLKLIYDSLLFVGPEILNRLTKFIQKSSDDDEDSPPASEGYTLVAIMFGSAVLQSIVLHQYFHRTYRTGMRLKSSVISLVFAKALRINAGAVLADDDDDTGKGKGEDGDKAADDEETKDGDDASKPLLNGKEKAEAEADGDKKDGDDPKSSKKSSGEIVNLMSVDAQRMQDLMSYFAMLISAPYQMALSLYFLWVQIGPAVFAGVAVMVLIVPLTGLVAAKSRKLQKGLMTIKDERIKVTNEVLAGIKILKLYAWERPFGQKIDGIRERELVALWKYMLWSLMSRFLWTVVPILVAVAAFSAYTLTGGELTPAKAFTALALFNILRFPLAMFPMMVSYTVEASLSVARLRNFLVTPEVLRLPAITGPPLTGSGIVDLDDNNGGGGRQATSSADGGRRPSLERKNSYFQVHPGVTLVEADDAELRWPDGTPLVEAVNLRIKSGELCTVVGQTGSGKSGLLYSFIGDLVPTYGRIKTRGHIAYVAQTAWIQNGTMRENILFGAPYNAHWYRSVLHACALLPDLHQLAAGDATEIGEKGINLSGGQKQRVALARAVYNNADVYLLDDCLSAVDSQVAAHIFEHCIRGLLAPKAVVLVTHNMHVLPFADTVVLLERREPARSPVPPMGAGNGHHAINGNGNGYDLHDDEEVTNMGSFVAFCGGFQGFLDSGHPFAALVDSAAIATAAGDATTESDAGGDGVAVGGDSAATLGAEDEDAIAKGEREAAGKLIEQEGVAVGKVGGEVYYEYMLAAGGFWFCSLIPLGLVVYQSFLIGTNYWLSYWSDHSDTVDNAVGLGIYSALSAGGALSTLLTLLIVTITGVAAARVFHRNLIAAMMRAPMAFFDTTPLGRILNRFSKDTYTIDEQLMSAIYSWMSCLAAVFGIVVVISFATPFFLLCLLPLGAFYIYTQNYYIPTSRELKRLDGISRSPVFSAFGEVLEGVSTIRAFRAEDRFISDEYRKLDRNLQAYYLYVASNRWLAMRLEFVGTCIVTFAAMLAVIGRHDLPAGLAALSVSYALNVTQSLNWMVRMTSDRESYIVSVERVKEYTEVEPEAPAETQAHLLPPPSWPFAGRLTISNLELRYRPGLPLVLRGLTVDITPGQRVGIVGRTGAGKSSMLIALLRLVEADGGSIKLDGVELRDLGLDDVRGRVSIIPQDPVLFTGSVRSNLDPFGRASDEAVWSALDRAHLGDHIRLLPGGLSAEVEEGGRNFSLGERQMLCFARALIRRSKLLLLDEATSAVDPGTDALIQRTLREEFTEATILTIAHRIDTILDYDRILVMSAGQILEDGPANELLQNPNGEFYAIYEAHRQGLA